MTEMQNLQDRARVLRCELGQLLFSLKTRGVNRFTEK
jgi:hypothetical protein